MDGAPEVSGVAPDRLPGLVLVGRDAEAGQIGGNGIGHPALVP